MSAAQERAQRMVLDAADRRVDRLMLLDVAGERTADRWEWRGEVSVVHVETSGPRSAAELLTYLGAQGWVRPMPRPSPAPPLSLLIAETERGDSIADFLLCGGGRGWLADTVGLRPGVGGLFQLLGAHPQFVNAAPSQCSRPVGEPVPARPRTGRVLGPADDFDY